MLDLLLNYISQQKLFQSQQKVLLAVSGGIDSMTMVHLFKQTGFQFAIAHCNFQLRGEESIGDQILVETEAKACSVPVFVKHFDTESYAAEHGISIQMAARDLRRAWFAELLIHEGYDVVATAHHLNDSLETVLFNLAKGTGISGIKGIPSKKDAYIRPLMFASREMIINYARKNNLDWREDRSNSSTKYRRNLLRHKVVPELKKINPNLEETFAQSMQKITASERIFRRFIEEQREAILHRDGDGAKIDMKKLIFSDEPEIILFELIVEFGFNYRQTKDILAAMDGQSGKSFSSKAYSLVIDRSYLFISKKYDEVDFEISIEPGTQSVNVLERKITFERVAAEEVSFSGSKDIAWLDLDKLKFPLLIRKWKPGDRFQPLGMKDKKKLSDFMIDEKIPLNLKKQVLVLISGTQIVWVIGHRIDERYKISKQTQRAYKICYT